MDIDRKDTALLITDAQNDFLSEQGVTWELVGDSVKENRTVENIEQLFKTAKAKGLSQFKVVFKHALRNALIPVVTTIGLQFGVLLCGAILTETIFAWPGVGKWIYNAVMQRDYMVIRGGTLFLASIFIVINLFVDVLYAVINPRIKVQ